MLEDLSLQKARPADCSQQRLEFLHWITKAGIPGRQMWQPALHTLHQGLSYEYLSQETRSGKAF